MMNPKTFPLYEWTNEGFRVQDPLYSLDLSCKYIPSLEVIRGSRKELLHREVEQGCVEVLDKDFLLEQYGVFGGKKHGRFQLYFPSGKLASERWYIDGVLWGRALDYFLNGNARASFGYVNGRLHGPFRLWHESGGLAIKGEYVEGLAQGPFEIKNLQGQVLRMTGFEKGRRDGSDAGFTDDGYLVFLDMWKDGERKQSSFFDCIERYLGY